MTRVFSSASVYFCSVCCIIFLFSLFCVLLLKVPLFASSSHLTSIDQSSHLNWIQSDQSLESPCFSSHHILTLFISLALVCFYLKVFPPVSHHIVAAHSEGAVDVFMQNSFVTLFTLKVVPLRTELLLNNSSQKCVFLCSVYFFS